MRLRKQASDRTVIRVDEATTTGATSIYVEAETSDKALSIYEKLAEKKK